MKSIVILISGRGSNMEAIVGARIPGVRIAAVISNRPGAEGLAFARSHGIATAVVDHTAHADRASFDAALAESWLGQTPALLAPAERRLAASGTAWDLAQGELARSGAARTSRRLGAAWRTFAHAPRWRPARWGLALLLLAQVAGLNLAAWRTRSELAERRQHVSAALTQSFPQVKVVVDAPVQMAREVAALRQNTGAASPRDLGAMLGAWAQQVDAAAVPTAFEFSPGELRVKGVQLSASALTQARAQLRPLGYRLDTEDGAAVLREGATP